EPHQGGPFGRNKTLVAAGPGAGNLFRIARLLMALAGLDRGFRQSLDGGFDGGLFATFFLTAPVIPALLAPPFAAGVGRSILPGRPPAGPPPRPSTARRAAIPRQRMPRAEQ